MQMRLPFQHVTTWVFDLDETLYPVTTPLFPQIERRMTRWIMQVLRVDEREANQLRQRWWHDHGTTLAGLMREHGADPDPFLEDVHKVDFSVLRPDPGLRAALAALPGRRIIYTNGTVPYARKVLAARGLSGLWDRIYGIEDADYLPKPEAEAYGRVFSKDGLDPGTAAMFEDSTRNLKVPFEQGMVTIHVGPDQAAEAHIHERTNDLTGFLRGILTNGPDRSRV